MRSQPTRPECRKTNQLSLHVLQTAADRRATARAAASFQGLRGAKWLVIVAAKSCRGEPELSAVFGCPALLTDKRKVRRVCFGPGLWPGLRYGHQTWLDDLGVRYVLQSERMGHEVPGMRGVYSHITPRMRAELRDGLQELWEASLHERALLAQRSVVSVLDSELRDRLFGP